MPKILIIHQSTLKLKVCNSNHFFNTNLMNSLGFPENVFNVTHRKTNKITNSDQFCL